MEPRTMALMNLCAGKEWRHRRREETCGPSEEGGNGMNGESVISISTVPCVR